MENMDLNSFRFKTDRGKTFFFDIMSNSNGRFLRITESRPRLGEEKSFIRNFMTIPEECVSEFLDNLKMAQKYLIKQEASGGE